MGNLSCYYDKYPCSEVNSTDSSDQPFKDIYSPREKQWISNILTSPTSPISTTSTTPTSTTPASTILRSSGKTYI